MGYRLCMAEKPSVAKDIAKVIGADRKCHGYFEGSGYRVTWAVGHLVGLAEPDAYGYVAKGDMYADEEHKKKAYEELPLLPDEFTLVVLDATKEQFEVVKDLINDSRCTEVINCGDMGPEGHILQWFIREKAGCTKPVRRFCATSMTDEAIREAMEHLRPEEEFANIIKGEYCKKKADWIMGMSLSRCASLKYGTSITMGRVQSPTLYFIVKRYLEAQRFKVTDYYGMEAELAEGFSVSWSKDTEGVFPEGMKDSEGRVLDKAEVEGKCAEIEKIRNGTVTQAEKKKRGTDRPQLYDITELQRDANRKYGYTAAETLAAAQALYETQKVLSYPRTDSRYITSDLKPYMAGRVKAVGTLGGSYKAVADMLLASGLNMGKRLVDDAKVTDHHALIPTEQIQDFDPGSMVPTREERAAGVTGDMMRSVLHLVLVRFLVAFAGTYIYEQTSIAVSLGGVTFTAGGSVPVEMGWRGVQERLSGKEEEDEDKSQALPGLEKGQVVTVKSCIPASKKTTPPKLHTEATLLTAMENAGATIENGAILKGRGIGTQATRAAIIKKLFDMGYVEAEGSGKTKHIIPTSRGLNVIKVIPQELYSPKITADWETQIAEIAAGRMAEEEFMSRFTEFIKKETELVKTTDAAVDFSRRQETYGECPFCGSDIYRYKKKGEKPVRFYCSSDSCGFSLQTDNPFITVRAGKPLTEKQCLRLMADGRITLACKRKAGDGTYKGVFRIAEEERNGKRCVRLEFGFPETKRKR